MNYTTKVFTCLVIVLIFSKEGLSIKCYQCNSHNDTRCADEKVPDGFLKDCREKNPISNKPYILCRKIKQSIDFEVNGLASDTRIIRSCGFEESSYKNKCYQRSGFGGRQEVCACDQDSCNSGNTIITPVFLLLGLFTSMRLFH